MCLQRIGRLMLRELRQLRANPRLLAVMLLTPLVYTLLLGSLYGQKRVTQIPAWVIDEDRSAMSRSIREAMAHSETFRIVREDGSPAEFREATRRGEAFACLWIPPDFERDVKRGKPVRLLTLIDASNMLIANTVLRGATEIGTTYGVGVQMKKLSMRGTPSAYALGTAMPIESVTRNWYNPAFNYMDFLLPGLIGTVIQQIVLLAVALALAREHELGQMGEVRAITSSPLEVLVGKSLVFIVPNLATAALAYLFCVHLFGVVFHGSVALFGMLLALFVVALVGMGVAFSAIAPDQLFATQALMLIAVPSFLLSGFTWPQISMSPAILAISNILPLTHFVLPLRQIVAQGADFATIRPHLLWLWIFAIVCYGFAYLVLRRRMAVAGKSEAVLQKP